MDGTFDSAPSIFQQLYVIRVPLGESAVSCVYAFLSSKTQATYEELLTAVLDRCCDLGFQPDPTTIITDFEQATINAVSNTLGSDVQSRGCFYHLTQSMWRKVQQLGLVTLYRSVSYVSEGMNYLKEHTPDGLEPLIDYFDSTYVSGSYRRIQRPTGPDGIIPPMKMRRISPMFPPELWNVHEVTISDESRTNNICEAWNNSYRSLVGCSHPSIWRTIDNLRIGHELGGGGGVTLFVISLLYSMKYNDGVVFVREGFCPGGIMSGGVFVRVAFVRVVFVRGGFCPYTVFYM